MFITTLTPFEERLACGEYDNIKDEIRDEVIEEMGQKINQIIKCINELNEVRKDDKI